jgi:hypothetical protein
MIDMNANRNTLTDCGHLAQYTGRLKGYALQKFI